MIRMSCQDIHNHVSITASDNSNAEGEKLINDVSFVSVLDDGQISFSRMEDERKPAGNSIDWAHP